MSLVLATLAANAGVLISLRARAVQEATQTLAFLLVPGTLLGPIVLLVGRSRPEWSPKAIIASVGPTNLLLIVLAVLVALDALLFIAASARFQRAKLILG